MLQNNWYRIFTLFFIITVVTAAPAFAYLDPGSGSYFVQMLIAGMAGGAYIVKIYYTRILLFFKSVFGGKSKNQ